jgi:MYXO-CTERM domain-containing protein
VKTRIEVNGTTVSWYLNGALVDTYDNSGGFYSDGNIFFGLTDPFNSSNSGNRLIVDNVLVVIPGPSTYALGALGLAGLWLLKRRRK